jgi:hypothetical protein
LGGERGPNAVGLSILMLSKTRPVVEAMLEVLIHNIHTHSLRVAKHQDMQVTCHIRN